MTSSLTNSPPKLIKVISDNVMISLYQFLNRTEYFLLLVSQLRLYVKKSRKPQKIN
jgi:hypothetical protein